MHSVIHGIATNFFCVLVDKDNQPMFCHLQCAPISKNTQYGAILKEVPDSFWAMLTIQNASQIGSALHFGSTYGLKPSRFNGSGPLARPKKTAPSKVNLQLTYSAVGVALNNVKIDATEKNESNQVVTGSAGSDAATTGARTLTSSTPTESKFQAFKAAIENAKKSLTSVSLRSVSDASAADIDREEAV